MKMILIGSGVLWALYSVGGCNFREDKIFSTETETIADPTKPNDPEKLPNTGSGDDSGKASFASIQKNIFDSKCTRCHKPGNAKGDVLLTSYNAVMEADPAIVVRGKPKSSPLYRTLIAESSEERMPQGAPPLSEQEIQTIYQWILTGALEVSNDHQ